MVIESNENLIATGLEAKISLPQKFHSNPATSKLIRSAFFKNDTRAIVKLVAEKVDKQELESNLELKYFLKSEANKLTDAAILHGYPEVVELSETKLTRKQFFALREAYNTRTGKAVDDNILIKKFKLEVEAGAPQKFHSNPVTAKLIRSAFFKNDSGAIVKLVAEKVDKQELESNLELKYFLKSEASKLTDAAILYGYPEVVELSETKLTRKQFFALREAYNTRTGKAVDDNILIKKFKLEVEAGAPQKFHSNPLTAKRIRSAFLKEDYEEALKLIAKNIHQEELDNNPALRNYLQLKSDKLIKASMHLDSQEINEKLKFFLNKEQNQHLQKVSDQKLVDSSAEKATTKPNPLRFKLKPRAEEILEDSQPDHQPREFEPLEIKKKTYLEALIANLSPSDLRRTNLRDNVVKKKEESPPEAKAKKLVRKPLRLNYDTLPARTKISKKASDIKQALVLNRETSKATSKPQILSPLITIKTPPISR